MNNSVVKIVNAAGRLVKEGTSVGGAFSWDRLTTEGKQAAAGIYYVLATDADGDNGVTKGRDNLHIIIMYGPFLVNAATFFCAGGRFSWQGVAGFI